MPANADAQKALDLWLELFDDRFYIELQRLGRPDEEAYIAAAVTLASRRGVPVVATNDVRFLQADDFESHEARVCIHEGALLADFRQAASLHAAAVLALAAGDGGAVCRRAGSAGQLGWRSRSAAVWC